jgi:hypothetical protein
MEEIKVVAPKSLVATMKERIAEMENLYKWKPLQ